MKGLLNATSRNPSASTHYFDPNTTDNLKYSLDDREWPGGEVESKMPAGAQHTSARAELGLAFESAATGRVPGSPVHPVPAHHDGAETAIFERVMGEYTEALHRNQSAVPVTMRLPMADVIADYGSDVHQENAEVDADTRSNMIKHYDDGQRQMYAMLRGMATKRGLADSEDAAHLIVSLDMWETISFCVFRVNTPAVGC